MQDFVRFHVIEPEIELSQKFGKNGVAAPPTEIHVSKMRHLMIYTLHIHFCGISFTRNRDQLIPKIPEKV